MNHGSPYNPAKKPKYSPSNIAAYEEMYKLEHDIAMGYKPPLQPRVPKVKSALDIFMEQNPVPSPLHESFRCWINRNSAAKFDCFALPNWECKCYKCVTWQKSENHRLDFMEAVKMDNENLYMKADVSALTAEDRLFMQYDNDPKRITTLPVMVHSKAATEKENAPPVVNSVSHIYTEFDMLRPEDPQTPKLSTVEFDYESDQCKAEAQFKWVMRMQKTPTNLRF